MAWRLVASPRPGEVTVMNDTPGASIVTKSWEADDLAASALPGGRLAFYGYSVTGQRAPFRTYSTN